MQTMMSAMSKHLAIYRKVPADISDDQRVRELALCHAAAVVVERWVRMYIPTYRTRGYLVASDLGVPTTTVPGPSSKNIYGAAIAQKPDDGFEPTHHMVWGGSSTSICGRFILCGKNGFTTVLCDAYTKIHEWFHGLCEGHANLWKPSGLIFYGDQTSVMGKKPRHGLNAINYMRLGIADKVLSVDEPGDYVLGCLETPLIARHPHERQILTLPGGPAPDGTTAPYFTLSRRKMRGFPDVVGPAYANTVFVHWPGPGKSSVTGTLNIGLGHQTQMPNGWIVKALEANANQILLRISR
jgi:hypothetical protein